MRVIAGKYRRKPLVAPPGTAVTRPTSDRVKESLFNILTPHLPDALVLDLFAGTGALGIEALSRGAERAIFVEKDTTAFQCLLQNLTKVGIPAQQVCALNCDVIDFLSAPQRYLQKFTRPEEFAASMNLILADPPYLSSWYAEALTALEKSGLCAADCVAALEMPSSRPTKQASEIAWQLIDERKYGQTRLELWQRNSMEPDS